MCSMESTTTRPETSNPWATLAWIVSGLLLVVLVVAIWLRVDDRSAGAAIATSIADGKRPAAPALPTDPVADTGLPAWYAANGGKQASSAKNKVLVVNWWASWCGPCNEEMPALQTLANEYDGTVEFVGINAGEEDLRSDARAFAKSHDVRYPLVRGDRNDKDSWGVTGFPETFVVGTDGRISSYINGPLEQRDLRDMIEAELKRDRA